MAGSCRSCQETENIQWRDSRLTLITTFWITNVSEEHAASIQQEEEGSMLFRNIGNHLLDYVVAWHRRQTEKHDRQISRSWDRASLKYSSKYTNKIQRYTIFFIAVDALRVSGGFSAYHQELKFQNCTHSIWYVLSLLAATASVGELELVLTHPPTARNT
jgi:hypothetical protein